MPLPLHHPLCSLSTACRTAWLALASAWLVLCIGCTSSPRNNINEMLEPSNYRHWKPNMAVLPHSRIRGDDVTVFNVRNCSYLDEDTYVIHHEDRRYHLSDLESVDFVVVPFKQAPSLAHTMLSFGFRDGRYLGVSVEVRLEEGESYSPLGGAARQFEIMYVVADERDLVRLRTETRDDEVYIFRAKATPEQAQALFVDMMKRVNQLQKRPEFYDTFMNNCTTNIVAHVNRLRPGKIPWDLGILLPGYSDQTAYSLGMLVDYGSFAETRRRAHVKQIPDQLADSRTYSRLIRTDSSTDQLAGGNQETIRR